MQPIAARVKLCMQPIRLTLGLEGEQSAMIISPFKIDYIITYNCADLLQIKMSVASQTIIFRSTNSAYFLITKL